MQRHKCIDVISLYLLQKVDYQDWGDEVVYCVIETTEHLTGMAKESPFVNLRLMKKVDRQKKEEEEKARKSSET